MRGRRLLTLAAVVATVGLGANTAQAVVTEDQQVQNTIVQMTGSTATPLTSTQVIDGVPVGAAYSPTGTALPTYVQDDAEGYSQFAVLRTGQSKARYDVSIPAGSRLELQNDGSVAILDETDPNNIVLRGMAAAPWAVDALGNQRATSYQVIDRDTIEQTVSLTGTTVAWPIVADPRWSLGWYITAPVGYAKYSRAETRQIMNMPSWPAYVASVACAAVPTNIGIAACMAAVNIYWESIIRTARSAYNQGKCLTVRMPIVVPYQWWAYRNIVETCRS